MKSIFCILACAISATIAAPMPLSASSVPSVARSNNAETTEIVDDIKSQIPEGAHLTVKPPSASQNYWSWVWTWSSSSTSSTPEPASSSTPSPTPTPSSTSSSSTSSGSTSNSLPGPVVDDYPETYKQHCGEIDQWSLTACQCVSFVAWRVSSRLDQDFSRAFDHETWSNANTWANAAVDAGVEVNNTPAPGAIAQTTAGEFGHVAWVVAVEGDNIRVEEYNAMHPLGYDTRIVSADTFQYIHIPMA